MTSRRGSAIVILLTLASLAMAPACTFPGKPKTAKSANEDVGSDANLPPQQYLWIDTDTSMVNQPDFSAAFAGQVSEPSLKPTDPIGPWERFVQVHDGILTDRMVVTMTIGTNQSTGSAVNDIVLTRIVVQR